MKCCFCGTVRNCERYLSQVLKNIDNLGNYCFTQYSVIIFYDESSDLSLQLLLNYKNGEKKLKPNVDQIIIEVNHEPLYPYRTWNLAKARNSCLHLFFQTFHDYDYFVMMDMDDVNCKNVYPEVLKEALQNNNTWDALSFQTHPFYYDTWALSIYPYCFSHNHFDKNAEGAEQMRKYVTSQLLTLPEKCLLPCISAFNGFAIYKKNKFINCSYEGKLNINKIPSNYILSHGEKTKSKLVFKNYGHIDGSQEDCEHRLFHMEGTQKNEAKICISPYILFK